MRIAAEEIMTPPGRLAASLGIPRDVFHEAFWRSERSRSIMASYFGDMRALATDLGLMPPFTKRLWRLAGIDGAASRFRGEPERAARPL
jgi:hypothetical protein